MSEFGNFLIRFLSGAVTGACVGLMLGASWEGGRNNEALKACARTHNVYQCKLVAVPVNEGE